jgi:hypothetical protein
MIILISVLIAGLLGVTTLMIMRRKPDDELQALGQLMAAAPPPMGAFEAPPPPMDAFQAPPPPMAAAPPPVMEAPPPPGETAKSASIVQNITYNIHDSAISGDLSNTLDDQNAANSDQPPPPLPPSGLPEGWTQEQWNYYGQEWLDDNN